MKAIVHEDDVQDLQTGLRFCSKNVTLLNNRERAAMLRLLWQLERYDERRGIVREPAGGGHAA